MGSFEMKKQAKNGLQSRSGCHGLSWPVMVLWMTVKDDCHGFYILISYGQTYIGTCYVAIATENVILNKHSVSCGD